MSDLYYGTAYGTCSFANWQMGLYFRSDVLNQTATWNAFNAAMYAFFQVGTLHAFGYLTMMAPSHKVTGYLLHLVDRTTDRKTRVNSATQSLVGTATEPGVPSMCAPYCLLTPAIPGGRHIGRIYLPPVSASAVTTNTVTLAKQQQIRDFLSDAFASLTGDQCYPIIRSRLTHTESVATKVRVANMFASVDTRNLQGGNDPKYESALIG